MELMVALAGVLLLAVVLLAYRLWKMRQGGTAALLRDVPAVRGSRLAARSDPLSR